MRMELPSLLKASGSTVLYVTQDYKEAMALGDKIAVLLDGNFAHIATPTQVYREPASLGVARLFGDPTVNLISATPMLQNGVLVFEFAGSVLPMPPGYAQAAGVPCIIGVRPESIIVRDEPSPGSFALEIVALTPLNEKSVLLLRAKDGRELLAAESGEAAEGRRHGSAFASFIAETLLVFDAVSGNRIAPSKH
jgi:multiple sugar transport system ATP-binding protein